MAKIYNEVIIDMNPESHSYMEVLHEDSFEYSGDMMLMSKPGDVVYYFDSINQKYVKAKYAGGGEWTWTTTVEEVPEGHTGPVFQSSREFIDWKKKQLEGGQEWGAAAIGANDFIDADGNPLSIKVVSDNLKAKFPEKDTIEIRKLVEQLAPQYQKVDPEEQAQLAKKREFAQRGAGLSLEAAGRAKEADIYGLQKQAGKMGGAMRGAYGGMGGGMRGAIGGQAGMAKGFGAAQEKYGGAQDAYSLAMDEAAFAEETGLYGLRKEARKDYETDIAGFIEEGEFEKGGRVPKRGETFLSFLTQLPDAGGS